MSAAITSLTLTEEDLLLLIKSEVLDAKLKDLPSLQSHLDSCRADRVRARIVDCSGCLVYKTDMVYSALSGVPSVGRLRSELTAHFEQVEASYHEEVQAAINTVRQRSTQFDSDRPPTSPEEPTELAIDDVAVTVATWEDALRMRLLERVATLSSKPNIVEFVEIFQLARGGVETGC